MNRLHTAERACDKSSLETTGLDYWNSTLSCPSAVSLHLWPLKIKLVMSFGWQRSVLGPSFLFTRPTRPLMKQWPFYLSPLTAFCSPPFAPVFQPHSFVLFSTHQDLSQLNAWIRLFLLREQQVVVWEFFRRSLLASKEFRKVTSFSMPQIPLS